MRCSMRSYAGSEPDAVALSACEHLGTFTGKNEIQFLAASPFTPHFPFNSRSLALSNARALARGPYLTPSFPPSLPPSLSLARALSLSPSLSLSLLSLSFFLFPFCGTLKITNCFSVVHIL